MQDILIHARDFKERTPACEYAVRLAAAAGAAATAIYAYPSPFYGAPVYGRGVASGAIVKAVIADMRAHVREAEQAGAAFVERAESEGVRHAAWVVVEGDAVDALVVASTRHDLLVLDHDPDAHADAWDMPGLILRSACPCLVLPHQGVDYAPIERVAIGWNGSPEAMCAVHSALPFIRDREVLLLRGEERERYPALEWHPPFDVEGYLARHGARLTSHAIDATSDGVGAALCSEAGQFGAGLLVVGAFGHTRFSEWLLGGATREVLVASNIPLLLQH